MKPEEMAIRLRTALRYIQSISSNMFFYDAQTGVSFHVANTLEILDKSFPEFTQYEKAFIRVVNTAAGSLGVEKFVILMRGHDPDFTTLENGTALMDMSLVFDEAYKLGLNSALGEAI
jgi:hypothetical protein